MATTTKHGLVPGDIMELSDFSYATNEYEPTFFLLVTKATAATVNVIDCDAQGNPTPHHQHPTPERRRVCLATSEPSVRGTFTSSYYSFKGRHAAWPSCPMPSPTRPRIVPEL